MNDKNVAIWGTGQIAKRVWNGIKNKEIVVAFIETNPRSDKYDDIPIMSPAWLVGKDLYTIVACDAAEEIHCLCKQLGIDDTKFIYLKYAKKRLGCKNISVIKSLLDEENFTYYCEEYKLVEESYFFKDAEKYQQLNKRSSFRYDDKIQKPVLTEKYAEAGNFGLYFWQDLWAASRIVHTGLKEHFDIGSRLDGFIAHLLASGIDVTMIDIREFPVGGVEHLHTICADATDLIGIETDSISSLSALCSLEHFGLGRYGDEIDPEACFKVFESIQRVMKSGGNLYISVPVGKECLEFNAHRMFNSSTIIESFSDFELKEFSTCLENMIEENVPIHQYDHEYVNGNYRYGLFWFVKK